VRKISDCFIEFWPERRCRLKVGYFYMRFRIQINFRWCLRIFKCHRLSFYAFSAAFPTAFSFRLASNWQLSWATWGTYLWNQIASQQAIYIYFPRSRAHTYIFISHSMQSVCDNWFRRTDSTFHLLRFRTHCRCEISYLSCTTTAFTWSGLWSLWNRIYPSPAFNLLKSWGFLKARRHVECGS